LKSLPKGYVLDVSGITQDGTGVKKMKEPTKGGKSKKVGIEGLAIVSNNYKAFDQAMKLMGRDYEKYSQQYSDLYGTGSEAVIPTRATISPRGRTRTASPPAKRTTTTAAPKRTASPPAKRTTASPPPAKRTTASPITRAP